MAASLHRGGLSAWKSSNWYDQSIVKSRSDSLVRLKLGGNPLMPGFSVKHHRETRSGLPRSFKPVSCTYVGIGSKDSDTRKLPLSTYDVKSYKLAWGCRSITGLCSWFMKVQCVCVNPMSSSGCMTASEGSDSAADALQMIDHFVQQT